MNAIKYQLNLFLLALGFFSRIPLPAWVTYSPELLNRASRYFTLVGWLLGALVALFFCAAHQFFSTNVSLWLSMVFSLLLTGAFHEDGLADTADGFGGAFERERKLAIMKDSRLGTYGGAALLMALGGKFLLLSENAQIATSLLLAYALSRTAAASLIFSMRYVSDSDNSKSKPLANNQSLKDLLILLACALPAILLVSWQQLVVISCLITALHFCAKYYFNKQIGGYTGDCLGATQQIAELSIYLALLLL
jgi:adenosylcobinamide-GDP ribazoletransferase